MGYASLQELAKLRKWHAKFLMLFLSGMPQRAGRINHVFIAPQVKGRGEQCVPTGCVFLGWGWRGVLDTWLVTLLAVILIALAGGREGGGEGQVPTFRCILVKISQDLWVKFTLKPLKLAIQTEERLIVSPEGICQQQREVVWYLGKSWRFGVRPDLPRAPDAHIPLPGEHVSWNVSQALEIQSAHKWPILLPSPAPAVLKISEG